MNHEFMKNIDYVVSNSKAVSINPKKAKKLAEELNNTWLKRWYKSAAIRMPSGVENRLGFLFIFNSISFSYWGKPKWQYKEGSKIYERGAEGMIAAITKNSSREHHNTYSPEKLMNLKLINLRAILKGNGSVKYGVQIPMLEERLDILNTLGKVIVEKFDGKFENFVQEGGIYAPEFAQFIIDNLDYMKDSANYKDREISFNKKAQLLTSDISELYFKKKHNKEMVNIDKLTACADYQIPNVLRHRGVLRYRWDVAKNIDAEKEIKSGSNLEIEIRANTIKAVELIKRLMNYDATSMQINDQLWLMAKDVPMDMKYPRVRTTKY